MAGVCSRIRSGAWVVVACVVLPGRAAEPEVRVCSTTMPQMEVRLVGMAGKFWKKNELKVKFLDGDPALQAKVARYAKIWSEHGNFRFNFGDHDESDLRVSFKERGSWSKVGTDAIWVPQNQPTMNFGWLTPTSSDEDIRQVVLHEFGHALGFQHEHQSPVVGIKWNKKAVYDHHEKVDGWDKESVDFNVFQTFEKGHTNYSEFDKHSIMLYPINKKFTTDGYETRWATALSETDKRWVARIYPKDGEGADAKQNRVRTWAVVSFGNDTKQSISYAFRWSESDKWEPITLAPGKRWTYWKPVDASPTRPDTLSAAFAPSEGKNPGHELSPEINFDCDLTTGLSYETLPVKYSTVERAGTPINADARPYNFVQVNLKTSKGMKDYLRLEDAPAKK